MLHSPTSSLASSSTSSSMSNSTLQPEQAASAAHRRRSVDNGGLNLALNDHSGSGSGRGWGGWEPDPIHHIGGDIEYAALVMAMREQTATTIDHAYPATSTTFLHSSELEAQRVKLIRQLANWTFDASNLSSDEVLHCACLLFEMLWSIEGMEESIGFDFESIPPFLARVSKIYRAQTSYHNFQHAVDVLQAVYCYLFKAGCVPCIDILLNQKDGASLCQPTEGSGGALPSTSDTGVNPPAPRQRKMWRKPPPEGKPDGLLKRALRNEDIFALFIAGVGHDIAHPGVSNKFLSNAKAPLAELFDDESVLEKFHCTMLLQVMRTHRMVHLLDRNPRQPFETRFTPAQSRPRTESDPGVVSHTINSVLPQEGGSKLEPTPLGTPPKPFLSARPSMLHSTSTYRGPSNRDGLSGTGTGFRDLLMKSILVTDMSVHFKWMLKMDELLQKVHQDDAEAGNDNEVDSETRILLCQALIKCADISNPSRPPPICSHWSLSLLSEWAEQAMLEKQFELPISVSASDDPIEAAKGQVTFIETFTKPLLQATCAAIPEMDMFVKQCDANLDMWKRTIEDANSNAVQEDLESSHTTNDMHATSSLVLPTSLPDVSTMFALSLPITLHTPGSEFRTQPPWPDISGSPLMTSTQPDSVESGQRAVTPTPPDSRPSSPPSNPTHRRHTSHTQLPQVCIPAAASTSFSPLNSQHAKSSSTASASASSPLFSPRSIPTSSSSPRSDVSSGSIPNTMGLQVHPLRTAYDVNARPKATKRLENRTSWQGSASGSLSGLTPFGPLPDSSAPFPPCVSNGS